MISHYLGPRLVPRVNGGTLTLACRPSTQQSAKTSEAKARRTTNAPTTMSSSPHRLSPKASDVFSRPPPRVPPPLTEAQLPHQQPNPVFHPPQPLVSQPPATASPLRPASSRPQQEPQTIDEMCDSFLAGPSPRLDRGLEPLVDPPQVLNMGGTHSTTTTTSTDFERIQSAARRRSWSVVITMAHPLLHGSSHYAPLFASLNPHQAVQQQQPAPQPSLQHLALQTHQEELCLILQWILQALVATGARAELTRTLQSWTFCHHHHHHRTTSGASWIPWSLHIQAAAALQYTTTTSDETSNVALDALWNLASDIPRSEISARYQVENALSNVCVMRKEWRMALGGLERMMEMKLNDTTTRMELLSRQGRILLQAGALSGAATVFARVAELGKDSVDDDPVTQAFLPVNDGLLQFSKGDFEKAMNSFVQAIDILRTLLHNNDETTVQHEELYADTINNMALSALYACRIDEALHLMESLVREDPTAFLTDRVAMNLCTLYELASDAPQAARKKRVLSAVAKRFGLHDIPPECFRVNGQ